MGNNLCCLFHGESKARQGEWTAVSDLSELQSMWMSSCLGPGPGVGKARIDKLVRAYIDSFTYEKSHAFSGEEFGIFTVKKQQEGQFLSNVQGPSYHGIKSTESKKIAIIHT